MGNFGRLRTEADIFSFKLAEFSEVNILVDPQALTTVLLSTRSLQKETLSRQPRLTSIHAPRATPAPTSHRAFYSLRSLSPHH